VEEKQGLRHDGQDQVGAFLKTCTPSAVDVELNGLCRGQLDDAPGKRLLLLSLSWFTDRLTDGADFDMIQAYLHRFLKIHAEVFGDAAALFFSFFFKIVT